MLDYIAGFGVFLRGTGGRGKQHRRYYYTTTTPKVALFLFCSGAMAILFLCANDRMLRGAKTEIVTTTRTRTRTDEAIATTTTAVQNNNGSSSSWHGGGRGGATTTTTNSSAIKTASTDDAAAAATAASSTTTKHILYYTKFFGTDDFQFGVGHRPFVDYKCPVNDCYATAYDNKDAASFNNLSSYDAVLFHAVNRDFTFSEELQSTIRRWRKPHQRFVFFIMESQNDIYNDYDKMGGFFNWTMTFKWDSDIPRPYGWFRPKKEAKAAVVLEQEEQEQEQDMLFYPYLPERWIPYDEGKFMATLSRRDESFLSLARRPKKVAWIVSNCNPPSKRNLYVQKLRQYGLQVDQFGTCPGSVATCDKSWSITDVDTCTATVEREYKFYLSFENILCEDYVTEKFFRRVHASVAITLGGANYTAIAPPHSYVSVLDFPSVKALVKYVQYLDANDEQYLSYFWWKDYYQVKSAYNGDDGDARLNNYGRSMCNLCKKLHDDSEPNNKVYDDMNEWWTGRARCGSKMPQLHARMRDSANK